MTNAKQHTPRELFEMWYSGTRQIPELAKTYGYDYRYLSTAFTRMLKEKKKPILAK